MKILYSLTLAVFLFLDAASAKDLIMPKELAELADEAGCSPINDFFINRPGHVDPPYLYGYAPGTGMLPAEEKSTAVVFWCINNNKENPEPQLVFGRKAHHWHGFSLENSAKQLPCPNLIHGHGKPAGLSVQTPELPLDMFHYLDDPTQKGPQGVIPSHAVLNSSYDGAGRDYYCHNGHWLVAPRH